MEVTLVDKMGTDLTVVNAARVSFGKKKKKFTKQDAKLISYLALIIIGLLLGIAVCSFIARLPYL